MPDATEWPQVLYSPILVQREITQALIPYLSMRAIAEVSE